MKSIKEFWVSSPPELRDYLFIYSWGALWASVYLLLPPYATLSVFNVTLVLTWTLVTIAGSALGVVGLINKDNLLLERFGVNLLMIGPFAFALTQLGLLIFGIVTDFGDPVARIHLIFFALWPYLFLNKRRRQLKARVKLVKKIPLTEEAEK